MDDGELIRQYIELNPHKPWQEEALLKDSGIAVWAIIGAIPAVGGDLDQVATDYAISRSEVDAALAYYRHHRSAIDTRLAANQVLDEEAILFPADVWQRG